MRPPILADPVASDDCKQRNQTIGNSDECPHRDDWPARTIATKSFNGDVFPERFSGTTTKSAFADVRSKPALEELRKTGQEKKKEKTTTALALANKSLFSLVKEISQEQSRS